jgi:hypothetical protein
MMRHAEVDRHASCRASSLQIGEERQGAIRCLSSSDPLETLVEASLVAVLELAHEAPHADRQRHDHSPHDVDHVAPPGPVRRHRRPRAARTQGHGMAARHMYDRSSSVLVNGAKDVHVAPSKAQVDTVSHGPWLLCQNRSFGARDHLGGGCPTRSRRRLQHSFAKTPLFQRLARRGRVGTEQLTEVPSHFQRLLATVSSHVCRPGNRPPCDRSSPPAQLFLTVAILTSRSRCSR